MFVREPFNQVVIFILSGADGDEVDEVDEEEEENEDGGAHRKRLGNCHLARVILPLSKESLVLFNCTQVCTQICTQVCTQGCTRACTATYASTNVLVLLTGVLQDIGVLL